jgi:hypothetical protein
VTTGQLLALTDEQLAAVDPLAVNLIVAREIPSLAGLHLAEYQEKVNAWALDFGTRYLPFWESSFQTGPECYLNDRRFFSVGMLCQYLRCELGAAYNADQREIERIRYTNPGDLFLNGVLDSLQGTCSNMSMLALTVGWRMGWAVSLACVRSHFVLRYDDGDATFNFETTARPERGFCAPADHNLIADYCIPPAAIASGSDVRALTPRERLGAFIGLRARHFRDCGMERHDRELLRRAEQDYLLARYLFPAHRVHNRELAFLSALFADERFEAHEAGHWLSYGKLVGEVDDYQRGLHEALRPIGQRRPTGPSTDCVLAGCEYVIGGL